MKYPLSKKTLFPIAGLLFLLDQGLKYLAQHNQETTWYLIDRWLGWEYLANPGIAFGLPVPQWFLLIITPIFFFILIAFFLHTAKKKTALFQFALVLILLGGLSNYIDRVLYGITVDYIRAYTSIFNIADAMIVFGAFFFFIEERKRKPCGKC